MIFPVCPVIFLSRVFFVFLGDVPLRGRLCREILAKLVPKHQPDKQRHYIESDNYRYQYSPQHFHVNIISCTPAAAHSAWNRSAVLIRVNHSRIGIIIALEHLHLWIPEDLSRKFPVPKIPDFWPIEFVLVPQMFVIPAFAPGTMVMKNNRREQKTYICVLHPNMQKEDNVAEKQLKGVIFDLDGVLVTTDTFHYQAWKMLADELGMDFDETVNHQLRGVSREESLRRIYKHNNKELPSDEEFKAQTTRKNEKYKELIGQMTPDDVLPGSIELLTSLRSAGIKAAIASASKNTPLVLERTGLIEHVDGVADGNQVSNSKPHPEVFLLAAKKLDSEPEACIGVEDAESGVEAIHNAGMKAVGIGSQGRKAEIVVDSVKELSIESFTKLLNS